MSENTEFTFVTYNIDAQQYNFEERLKSLLKLIKDDPPDVLVIQEGTRLTYEKLLRKMGLLGYKRILLENMHHRPTGEMIFSKFPISNPQFIPFPRSSDNGGISLFKLDIWGVKNVWVCTSQFDIAPAFRRTQVSRFPFLLKNVAPHNIIFGGDTRIQEYQYDLTCPEGWYDAWYEGGTSKGRYTYDSESNLLVPPPYKDRPDRIWYHPSSQRPSIECVDCRLYGMGTDAAISSHYGVKATFKIISLPLS